MIAVVRIAERSTMTPGPRSTTLSTDVPAPQAAVLDPAGRRVPVRDLWAGAPNCLVLVFLRQLG